MELLDWIVLIGYLIYYCDLWFMENQRKQKRR